MTYAESLRIALKNAGCPSDQIERFVNKGQWRGNRRCPSCNQLEYVCSVKVMELAGFFSRSLYLGFGGSMSGGGMMYVCVDPDCHHIWTED